MGGKLSQLEHNLARKKQPKMEDMLKWVEI